MAALRDVAAAWARLCAVLPRLPEREPALAEVDRELAAFVLAQPGVLESRLHDGVAELATAAGFPDFGLPSALACLLNDGGELPDTMAACDPAALLAVHARARREQRAALGDIALHNSVNHAAQCAQRAGRPALVRAGLTPEFRDHVAALVWQEPLPDILPRDLSGWPADAIEQYVADYVGLPVAALSPLLRAGGGTGGVFLAAGERFGDIVQRDATTLHDLGVDRHQLAERLDALLPVGKGPTLTRKAWSVHMQSYCGHQHDPFHSADAYRVHRRGATDFQILHQRLPEPNLIRGGDLAVVLIRRAAFFQGSVPYRIDPAQAARVLELVT